MKFLITGIFIVLFGSASLAGQEFKLAESWDFALDPGNTGIREKRMSPEYAGTWQTISTGFWEKSGYIYDGYAWYRQRFELPSDCRPGARLTLCFGAIDEEADIWLNGVPLGHHAHGWMTPFELDITRAARFDRPNTLVVRVLDNDGVGGIWKPVSIRYRNREEAPPAIRQMRQEKIRAISAPLWNEKNGAELKTHGINTTLVWSYIMGKAQPGPKDAVIAEAKGLAWPSVEREARAAASSGMYCFTYFWGLNTDVVPFLKAAESRRFVDVSGRRSQVTPCPADEAFWGEILTPLLVRTAEIHKHNGTSGGGAVDFEFYTGDFAGAFCYNRTALQGCYCDHCFNNFCAFSDISAPGVQPEQRAAFIREYCGEEPYLEYLGTQVREQAAKLAQAVRGAKDDFLLGLLPGTGNWFLDNVAHGFASAGLPVVIFDEDTYFTGENPTARQSRNNLKEQGLDLIFVGGLTIGAMNGEGLAAKAVELARQTDGFWLYHGATLRSKTPRVVPRSRSEFVLREQPESYWKALETAKQSYDSPEKFVPRPGKRISLLNRDFFPELPPGMAVSAQGFVSAGNMESNGSGVNRILPEKWQTFNQPPTIVDAKTIRFELDPVKVWRSIFQTVTVTPGKSYIAEVNIDRSGNSLIRGELKIIRSSGVALVQAAAREKSGKERLRVFFTAPPEPVYAALIANGTGGTVIFENAVLYEAAPEFISSPLPDGDTLHFLPDDPKTVDGELVDLSTGLALFELQKGNNNLTVLRRLFPHGRLGVRLTPHFSVANGQCRLILEVTAAGPDEP